MKSSNKLAVALACLALSVMAQAQNTPPTATPSSTTKTTPPSKLGSKALGAMDAGATQAMGSIGRSNANVASLVAGAGAAVAPQNGATDMNEGLSGPSIAAIALAGLALGGGGGGGGSTGTTPR